MLQCDSGVACECSSTSDLCHFACSNGAAAGWVGLRQVFSMVKMVWTCQEVGVAIDALIAVLQRC